MAAKQTFVGTLIKLNVSAADSKIKADKKGFQILNVLAAGEDEAGNISLSKNVGAVFQADDIVGKTINEVEFSVKEVAALVKAGHISVSVDGGATFTQEVPVKAKTPKAEGADTATRGRAGKFKDTLIKVVVDAANSGLREGSGRFLKLQFLGEVGSVLKPEDVLGKVVNGSGTEEVKIDSSNLKGMFDRGHIAVSKDGGVTWEQNPVKVKTPAAPAAPAAPVEPTVE